MNEENNTPTMDGQADDFSSRKSKVVALGKQGDRIGFRMSVQPNKSRSLNVCDDMA
jgi:hypothetical protein